MKNTKTESAFQKMLLVTPLVYQKLLNCINEKDKLSTEELNIPKVDEIKSSSEKIMEQISDQDIGIQPPENITENIIPLPVENLVNIPIPIENIPENIPEEIIPKEAYSNPLRNSCPQDTDQGSIIPTLFYRPSFKTKKVTRPIKKLQNKPLALDFQPDTFSDTRTLGEQDVRSTKNLPPGFQPKTLRQEQQDFSQGYPCTICGHDFTRKHDLKRHMASRTVHRNLKSINKPVVDAGGFED